MLSMTGYGKGAAEAGGKKVSVELRAVNHRFLDVAVKLPRPLAFLEESIRKILTSKLSRGHVDVFLTYEDGGESGYKITLNRAAAERYAEIGAELEGMGFAGDLTVSQVLKLPDALLSGDEFGCAEEIADLTAKATKEACFRLIEMRSTEGGILKKDFYRKIAEAERLADEIAARAPAVVEEYGVRLAQRVAENLNGVEIDETKLMNEIAFFIDKVDIDEEITRLRSHIGHFREILEEDGPVGKKLDFLVQEMNREVNTTGSKSNDLRITEGVLKLKNELEKLREQVQNIE